MATPIIDFMKEHYRFLNFWITNNVMSIKQDDLLWCPTTGKNHIYWLFGHIVTHMDMAPTLIANTENSLPPIYPQLFGQGSTPDTTATNYPPFEDMIQEFRRLGKLAVKTIGSLQDDNLSAEPEREFPDDLKKMFPNKGAILRGNSFHMAYHNGQIGMLKALLAT